MTIPNEFDLPTPTFGAEISERLDKLEHDQETMMVALACLAIAFYFLVRELYSAPEVKQVTA